MKILIVDDELHIRQGLEHLDWDSIGMKVCGTTANGQEAMELAAQQHPDIILSDIKMPGLDGLEMTERLLQSNPHCAVIFLSGYREFTYARKALALGAFDYLLKPTNPEEVLSCCKRAADKINQTKMQNINIAEMKYKIKEMEIAKDTSSGEPLLGHSKSKVGRIMDYIETHYCNELSLQDVADEFHFNSIYINRLLKKETGYTFLEIVNNKRMSKAAEHLKRTDIKIAEVAALIGIPDQRYFSQIFKKYYGHSPRQYRKLILKKQETV